MYTVYIRCFWQGNHQIYGHIRCIYTVLANPNYVGFEIALRINVLALLYPPHTDMFVNTASCLLPLCSNAAKPLHSNITRQ